MADIKRGMNIEMSKTLFFPSKSSASRQEDKHTEVIDSSTRKLALTTVSKIDCALESRENHV